MKHERNLIDTPRSLAAIKKQKKGFTLLEFLLALFLASLLIVLTYQIYAQVLKAYQSAKEDPYPSWFNLTESLRQQLKNIVCEPISFKGRKRPFFYFEEGTLSFLTRWGPGGIWLVIYKPEEEKTYRYFEKPYLGERLVSLEEFIEEKTEESFKIPAFDFRLVKISSEGEEEEITDKVESLGKGIYCLEVSSRNMKRKICFEGCS